MSYSHVPSGHDDVGIYHGDCLDVLAALPDASVDSVVTDPPYGLAFMGKSWDTHVDGPKFQKWCQLWATECLRVLKPGGHMIAFGGTRMFHRLTCAVEDAGFEIRDSIAWLYASGFPKSLDVSKAIDKAERGVPQGSTDPTSPNHGQYRTTKTEGKRWNGDTGQSYGAGGSRFLANTATEKTTAQSTSDTPAPSVVVADNPPTPIPGAIVELTDDAKTWQGWGTALKPAFEPIVLARKPLEGTVAANVLEHDTGGLNVDGCRVGAGGQLKWERPRDMGYHGGFDNGPVTATENTAGRWPPNVVLDSSAADELDRQSGVSVSRRSVRKQPGGVIGNGNTHGAFVASEINIGGLDDEGGASRFFPVFRYQAKAPTKERPRVDNIAHPTVKPVALMCWLVRLITPPGGIVVDPFAGSGTTAEACIVEGMRCIAIEREADYLPLIVARLRKVIQANNQLQSERVTHA